MIKLKGLLTEDKGRVFKNLQADVYDLDKTFKDLGWFVNPEPDANKIKQARQLLEKLGHIVRSLMSDAR